MKGYVYILTNPSMPGLIKIGRTVRPPERRALELYQTGVPSPFTISASVLSPDCVQLEGAAHSAFHEMRVNHGREFFKVDAHVASDMLDSLLLQQVQALVREFIDGYVLAYEPFLVTEEILDSAIADTDVSMTEMVEAVEYLSRDAILDAVATLRELRAAEQADRARRIN